MTHNIDWANDAELLAWVEALPIKIVLRLSHDIWHVLLPYSPIEWAFTGWCDG